MKVDPECFPCALSRVLCVARRVTDDPWLHHKLLATAMQELVEARKDITPAEVIFLLEGITSKTLGTTDAFQQLRDDWNEEVSALKEGLESRLGSSDDALRTALYLSGRANVFDNELLPAGEVRAELRALLNKGGSVDLAHSDTDLFLGELSTARSLLFIHDSGPELLFDRFLIEELCKAQPEIEIRCVVRKAPILLDATHADADYYSLGEIQGVEAVIDPGLAALGIPLNECSREFRDVFEAADLVIAKGQANYETLDGCNRTIYHLLRVKCAVMARRQGLKVADVAFLKD